MMRLRSTAALLLALLTLACSEPPYKEMHQAEGALDAAKAAGAETFAAAEYRDARNALDQSQQAVTQRDYRLALSYALDASDRAREAARAAANHKAEARGHAERALATAENALREAEARLKTPGVARLRARDLAPARKAIATTQEALQKARAAMEKEAYLSVAPTLEAAQAQLTAAMQDLTTRETRRPTRARRTGRSGR
jgi:hypothetical protein